MEYTCTQQEGKREGETESELKKRKIVQNRVNMREREQQTIPQK